MASESRASRAGQGIRYDEVKQFKGYEIEPYRHPLAKAADAEQGGEKKSRFGEAVDSNSSVIAQQAELGTGSFDFGEL